MAAPQVMADMQALVTAMIKVRLRTLEASMALCAKQLGAITGTVHSGAIDIDGKGTIDGFVPCVQTQCGVDLQRRRLDGLAIAVTPITSRTAEVMVPGKRLHSRL